MKGVSVVIPAFNEAANIERVVAELKALSDELDILVVDDGSTDSTAESARRAGANVVRMPFNTGIGASVQAGIRVALARGCRIIVRIDGDGQHDPRNLHELLEPIRSGEVEFVLGSRYIETTGFQASPLRRMGIRWFTLLLRVVCGLRISDPTSGFWAASRRTAELLAIHYSSDYPEVDSLVRLQRAGFSLREVAVEMRPRIEGRSSIHGFRTLYYMVKVTLALLLGRLQPAHREDRHK